MAGLTTAVRDALASLARSFKRVSVYRHARDQHARYLEPALAELRSMLELRASVTVAVEPGSLLFEGEVVHSEPARETSFCFRLFRDGVRSLTFRRGLVLDELIALAEVAMADPQAEGGREDAVTELWKADLQHIGYSAGAGYRMDESAGDTISNTVSEIAEHARDALDRHVSESFVDVAQQPVLWSDEQRARGDAQDYSALARRASMTILRIVEQDYAGWDLQSLQETFCRLVDQVLERGQPQALAPALDRLGRLAGSHGAEFRAAVGGWLSDPVRLEQVVKTATGSDRPAVLGPWLQILPPAAGRAVLAMVPLGGDPAVRLLLANAALARIESCGPWLPDMLRRGGAPEVQALLTALAPLPPQRRAELATSAFENPDTLVKLEAIPLLAADAATAVKTLGGALGSAARTVRVAAVQALAGCASAAEPAASLLLQSMSRPQFALVDKEEQTLFYRSLGKLGSNGGFSFLLDLLDRPPRKLFGRRKAIDAQLLAVQGLAEDGSPRALRALEGALLESRGHAPAVVAACRAAAQYVRAAAKGGRTA